MLSVFRPVLMYSSGHIGDSSLLLFPFCRGRNQSRVPLPESGTQRVQETDCGQISAPGAVLPPSGLAPSRGTRACAAAPTEQHGGQPGIVDRGRALGRGSAHTLCPAFVAQSRLPSPCPRHSLLPSSVTSHTASCLLRQLQGLRGTPSH
ncbi:PREDICTED: uncharacterized protein LOC106148269 isoform X1 [Chinchilla lanigera]|uniref:uncharacterized protein LOC106148269 isoform X1 n=1 Tax=Chinchilla lanigera TaxID=34839 RepID=UPI0006971B62|nr:PREDICTED: uncharacterized protein LOC106148269 isoform X1 [Chinchilla lanigera]